MRVLICTADSSMRRLASTSPTLASIGEPMSSSIRSHCLKGRIGSAADTGSALGADIRRAEPKSTGRRQLHCQCILCHVHARGTLPLLSRQPPTGSRRRPCAFCMSPAILVIYINPW